MIDSAKGKQIIGFSERYQVNKSPKVEFFCIIGASRSQHDRNVITGAFNGTNQGK